MADETIVYGQVDGDDQSIEINYEALIVKVAALEQENTELVHQNELVTERAKKLKDEMHVIQMDNAELKRDIDKYEADMKVLESVAARAADLETEVSRLQHDLVSALSDGQDANAELSQLKGFLSELRNSDSEKGRIIEGLEKERNLLLQRMGNDVQGVNELKAESESRIWELEKNIEALEVRESNLKIERVRVEEETRAKVEEKDGQIRNFKMLFGESQSVIARNKCDMERSNKEKEELEIVKNDLEGLLKRSERRVKEMEQKMSELHMELEASEKMISGLKEKTLLDDGISINEKEDRAITLDDKRFMGLKLELPVIEVSAVASAAAVAIFFLRYARRG